MYTGHELRPLAVNAGVRRHARTIWKHRLNPVARQPLLYPAGELSARILAYAAKDAYKITRSEEEQPAISLAIRGEVHPREARLVAYSDREDVTVDNLVANKPKIMLHTPRMLQVIEDG